MRIKSVRAVSVEAPPRNEPQPPARRPAWRPVSMSPYRSSGPSHGAAWPSVFVKVSAEDGTWGLGRTSYGRATAAVIDDHLGPLLEGEDCLAVEKCFDLMSRATRPYGTVGIASCAISAIDLALWDLAGKLSDRPVYELLGGPVRDSIAAYATGNDVDWYAELGFKAVKLACQHGPTDGLDGIAKNEEFVARARETAGPDIEIMLDCYMAFDVEYTVRLAERLRPYGLNWIEECLPPDDLEGHCEARRRLPWQTLASGEHMFMPDPFQRLVERRAVDILQPDIFWVGGLTAVRRICHIADAAGIRVILHGGAMHQYGLHATAAMPNTPWGEFYVGTAPGIPVKAGWRDELSVVDGAIFPSEGVGFGLGVEESWIRPFFD